MTQRPAEKPAAGPSPLKVALVLVPIALIAIAGVWIVVNLGAPASPVPGEESSGEAVAGQTVDAILTGARKAMSEGEPARAQALLELAVEEYPAEQGLAALHAESLLALDRTAEALAEFERACFVGPDSAAYRDFAGVLAAQLGEDETADTHWAVAQKLAPDNPKYPLYRAQVQRRMGDNDAARASLLLAARLDPELAEAWASLAAIALDENRPAMVAQYIERARALDPDSVYYRVLEARGLRRQGEAEMAASLLYAIPEAQRNADPTVLAELALCMGMLGEPERAAEMYIAAANAAPQNAEIAYEAALWLSRAGRPDEARALAARAESLGSEQAAALLAQIESGE